MTLSTYLATNGYEASAVMYALGLDPFLVQRVDAGEQYLPIDVCEAIARYTALDVGSVIAACGGAVTARAVGSNAPTYFIVVDGETVCAPLPNVQAYQANPASVQALPSASSQIQAAIINRTVPSP